MVREYRVLQAVHPHFPPAPQVYLVCEDAVVIGAPFFLMERRHGIVLRDQVPPELAAHENYADRISRAFIDCLVQLHAVDVEKHGLVSLGKPEGFVERQVRGWSERWERARTQPSPEMDRVMAWLAATIPPSGRPTLVHNDFKLDNVMMDGHSPDRIEAVLDWEMATVGDPLCDLGLTLCYWSSAMVPGTGATKRSLRDPDGIRAMNSWRTTPKRPAAIFPRCPGMKFSACLKLAVILQQIYFRFWRGQTTDERFRNFDQRVKALTTARLKWWSRSR